ncbi:MAG: alpha/beta hydrolase [Candidatus Margulisbacteria bacterium]|nr:alpha/beta hydrolase [Candidatus Margulisiibacteriota bacterium]
MPILLFIHGFATGPKIWQAQIREFSKDFHVVTDIEHVEHGSDVYLVGWSMGGWKALELWQEHHQKIKGLILVSAFAKYVRSDDYPCGTPMVLLRKLEKRFMSDYKDGMHYFYDLVFKDKKIHRLIDQLPVPEKHDVDRWFEKLRQEDMRELLPRINVPVLIIQGDQDPIVSPEAAEYLHGRIKDSELRVFAGVGHAPFLEKTREFNLTMRGFLAKNEN